MFQIRTDKRSMHKTEDLTQETNTASNLKKMPFESCSSWSCRICLQETVFASPSTNKLIDPCICMGSRKYIHVKCLEEWVRYWPNFMKNPGATTYNEKCPHCGEFISLEMVEGALTCKDIRQMGHTIAINVNKHCWLWILAVLILTLFVFNTWQLITMNPQIVEQNFFLYATCLLIEGIIACIILRWIWIFVITFLMERKLRIGKVFPPKFIERYDQKIQPYFNL